MNEDSRNGTWLFAATEASFDEPAEGSVIKKIDWCGPGNYYTYRTSQRCPRGCCWDRVYVAITADEWIGELRREIESLQAKMDKARTMVRQEIEAEKQ